MNIIPEAIVSWVIVQMFRSIIIVVVINRKKIIRPKIEV